MMYPPRNDVGAIVWKPAMPADEATVLALMRVFYAEEQLTFVEEAARTAVKALFSAPDLGSLFLLGDEAGNVRGYLVLTFGFSLEFRGRFVLLDELYVAADLRGQGLGKAAIEFAAGWARERGAAALRLEVNHANRRAKDVYSRRGFGDDRRDLMTRWV